MICILVLLLCASGTIYSQYDHSAVHPNKDGAALESALQSDFRPNTVLDLSDAKDVLYSTIYLENDSVSCVYTDLTKYLDPNEDPSQYLFQNGGNDDINLEHSYPQSKGANSGNAQSDMHHLFPTRVPVNSARGSEPYMELPDSETQTWYYQARSESAIPTLDKDLYSEDNTIGFEPREDFKGNVARAYFYFYTIYRSRAQAADPDFFESQRSTLCDWHELDPVDSLEWLRTYRIAEYQEDKPNPFVLDCSLARLYCGGVGASCKTVSTITPQRPGIQLKNTLVYPGEPLVLDHDLELQNLHLTITDARGQLVSTSQLGNGNIESPLRAGLYILSIKQEGRFLLVERFLVL